MLLTVVLLLEREVLSQGDGQPQSTVLRSPQVGEAVGGAPEAGRPPSRADVPPGELTRTETEQLH